ncbi:type II 3-dehydroquinate dehydratase [Photobacterium sanctipauli]|uniref:3-dehydroquinate dehydratase n=2 Tax=Photobacterium sanctipauli TaxID=1342794 RepID=A0A2T3P158_9GAMM|nr:type II 3-dehydroquinate dehydratase [Photobacterium sanctipauli]PSW22212.1 type II 3-dehydroquinate dehydratase [Photobacterium sanctipauli]
MSQIMVLNGPNLNLLGTREPDQYGNETLADVENNCRATAQQYDHTIDFRQSNHEGSLVDYLHEANEKFKQGELIGVIINPGAYTHTSVAIHDAIKGIEPPVIEVHISNVHARESFRHHSYVSPVAAGTLIGFGTKGYDLAIHSLLMK